MKLRDIQNALKIARKRFDLPAHARLEISATIHTERPTLFTLYVWSGSEIIWSVHNVKTLEDAMSALARWHERDGNTLNKPPCPTCGHTEATP